MIDATAEALSNHLLAKLPADRPHSRASLRAFPIPIAHYLGTVLDRRAAQKSVAPESPWLDEDNEQVASARRVWESAARAGARFPEGAWANAVRTASRQVLNYLVDPVDTLVSFAYTDGKTELMSDTLQERMASFSAYPYFREVAEGYIERKQLDAIDREEFEGLLHRIDSRMIANFETADWMTMLEPLFRLVKSIPTDTEGVPSSLLTQFFEAKGLDDIASKLHENTQYNEAQLREALNQVPKADELVEAPQAQESHQKGTGKADLPQETVEPKEVMSAETSPEPLWQRLAREKAGVVAAANSAAQAQSVDSSNEAAEIEPVDAPEQPHAKNIVVNVGQAGDQKELNEESSFLEETDTMVEEESAMRESNEAAEEVIIIGDNEAQPLWQQLVKSNKARKKASADAALETLEPGARIVSQSNDKIDKRANDRIESLRVLETRVLGPSATERRDWYAGHLAGGSEAAYRSILEDLDGAKDWNEAWPVLKEAYQNNRVEIYSDAIVAFTDAVEKHFSS